MLDLCIFFVTSACNSNCCFCFYKQRLNKHDDLSLDEIRHFAPSLGKFPHLLFSGGEPFLRIDLPEIVDIFISCNRVRTINIPTNGIDTRAIVNSTSRILSVIGRKNVVLSVNPSLDGLKDLDDRLRGRERAFSNVVATIEALSDLKKNHINLNISVNTVLSAENSGQIADIISYVSSLPGVDFHHIETVRPSSYSDQLWPKLDQETLKKAHLLAAQAQDLRLAKMKCNCRNFLQRLRKAAGAALSMAHIRYAQRIKEDFFSGKRGLFSCPAGLRVAVIEPDGQVRLCELREPVGSLRESSYDIRAVLSGPKASQLRRSIRAARCNCTHACFIDSYLRTGRERFDPRVLAGLLYHYLRFVALERKGR